MDTMVTSMRTSFRAYRSLSSFILNSRTFTKFDSSITRDYSACSRFLFSPSSTFPWSDGFSGHVVTAIHNNYSNGFHFFTTFSSNSNRDLPMLSNLYYSNNSTSGTGSNPLILSAHRGYKTYHGLNIKSKGPKPQPYKHLCILDFEATCDHKKNHFWPQEVIEFPVVVVDTSSLQVVDEFRYFCKPLINPRLTQFCKDLTGITQEEVDSGKPFPEVLALLHQFLLEKYLDPFDIAKINSANNPLPNANRGIAEVTSGNSGVSSADSALAVGEYPFLFVTCGNWDLKRMLLTQSKISNVVIPEYLKTWANIKEIAQENYGKSSSWSFRTLLRFLDLPMVGKHHSGIDDSRNIANAVITMINHGCVFTPTGTTVRIPSNELESFFNSVVAGTLPDQTKLDDQAGSSQRSHRAGSASMEFSDSDEFAETAKPRQLELDYQAINVNMVDMGANLGHHSLLPHIDEVVANAKQHNVTQILIPCTSLISAQAVASICQDEKYKNSGVKLTSTAGIHPQDVEKMIRKYGKDDVINSLREFILNNKDCVVAVGECGLDFENVYTARRYQEELFAKQINLGIELGLPLYLHERNAHKYFTAIYEPNARKVKGIIRCFSGTKEEMERYAEMGCYFGISGLICDERKNHGLMEVLHHMPLERIMIESNAPYHIPRNIPSENFTRPQRKSRRNEPSLVPWIAHKIARVKNMPPAQIVEIFNRNVREFFTPSKLPA